MPNDRFQNDPASSPRLAFLCVQVLRYLAGYGQTAPIDAIINADLGANLTGVGGGSDPTCPPWYFVSFAGTGYLFIGPTQSVAMGTQIMLGYTAPSDYRGANLWALNAALSISQRLATLGIIVPQSILVSGYSGGGMVCERFLNLSVQPVRTPNYRMITFGSPKVNTAQWSSLVAEARCRRWMLNNDPIPFIPPTLIQSPAIVSVLPVLDARLWSYYRHCAGGVAVGPSGQTQAAELPPQGNIAVAVGLAGFLYAQVTDQTSPHSLPNYLSAINNAIDRLAPAQTGIVPAAPLEVVVRPTPAQVGRIASTVSRQLAQQSGQQNVPNELIPPPLRFTAVNNAGTWSVYFSGTFIAVGPGKKKALAMKNAGNNLLKRMQRMGVVEPQNVVNQLSAYLGTAVDPAGGFVPIMQVNWPTEV